MFRGGLLSASALRLCHIGGNCCKLEKHKLGILPFGGSWQRTDKEEGVGSFEVAQYLSEARMTIPNVRLRASTWDGRSCH